MPTRYLKPGICDSDKVDKCTPIAECLFYRLLVNVDDYGRLDARPAVVRSKCFPLKDTINNKKTAELLQELHSNGLIILYKANGCDYLQLTKWDNIPRSKESKCPSYKADAIQLYTDVCNGNTNLPETETETETKTVTETETVNRNCVDDFDRFWDAYPKKVGKVDAKKAWVKNKPPIDDVLIALLWQSKSDQWLKDGGQYIPNPSTYINQGRWHDEPQAIVNKPKGYHDSISDTMRQIFAPIGENNGAGHKIIDITNQQAIGSGAEDIPKLGNGLWEKAG